MFRSWLEKSAILFRVDAGLIRKSEGGLVGMAGIVEVDPVEAADPFHGLLKRDGLRIEVARGMGAAGEDVDDLRAGIGRVGEDVDFRDGVGSESARVALSTASQIIRIACSRV